MAKIKKPLLILSFLLVLAFLLRAALSPLINKGDMLVLYEWSRKLYEEGLRGSYFRDGWIYSFPTQSPLMMLLFWVSRWLYEHRYFLALVHNIFRFPPASLITWFAENGEFFFLKFWAILGDILSGLLIYWLLLKISRKQKLALLGLAAFLFNPISIFISAIWGQNGMLAAFWVLLAFFITTVSSRIPKESAQLPTKVGSSNTGVRSRPRNFGGGFIFYWRWGKLLSPLSFTIGVLVKPTVLVLLPFYFVFLIRELLNSPIRKRKFFLGTTICGGLLSLLIILLLFIPFWDMSHSFLPYSKSVIFERIAPTAKGVSKASNSAFNIYSTIFTIDRTLGNYKFVFLSLDQIGTGLFLLINFFAALFWWRKNPRSLASRVFLLMFLVYFVAAGTFLFKTGMLERYFLPAFLPTIILFFMVEKRLKLAFLLQNLIWFVNLFYSFFLRDIAFVQSIFIGNHYLGVRLFSLFNVLIYVFIVFTLTKIFQKPVTK